MNKKVLIVLAILLAACSGEQEQPETISMEEFAGETGVIEEAVIEDSVDVMPRSTFDKFVINQLNTFDTLENNEFHPIDRFTFNQRRKVILKGKTTVAYGDIQVNPTAELFYYSFQDTAKTKNALYNWLDCFGSDCQLVNLKEDIKALKTPPMYALVYDTVIIACNYRCEDKSFSWHPIQDSITSYFGKQPKFEIKVGCGGPLKWVE